MLIICCGNPDCGDDGAGPLVAGHLNEMNIQAHLCRGEALSLLEAWRDAEDVLIVDAVSTGAPAGTIFLWDAPAAPLASRWFRCSTHAPGVAEAVALAGVLDRLPRRLRICGIAGRAFEPGTQPCAAVSAAARDVAATIAREGTLCTKLP
jgi:hydrogenase maturation protease